MSIYSHITTQQKKIVHQGAAQILWRGRRRDCRWAVTTQQGSLCCPSQRLSNDSLSFWVGGNLVRV